MLVRVSLPSSVGYVDASQIDALAAHYEERGKTEQRHPAADHGQLGWLSGTELQLLDDVAPQHDAHPGAGDNNYTCGESLEEKKKRELDNVLQMAQK